VTDTAAGLVRIVYLYPGDLTVSREPCTFNTIVGSCVAVFLWDERRKLGGMNHYLLPREPNPDAPSSRFGDSAMRILVEKLAAQGSEAKDLVAKVFGGAHVFGTAPRDANHLGKQNVDLAFEELQRLRIAVVASDVGGSRGRRLMANSSDGGVWVKEL
jgi:chemotaxis protein CheD